MLEKALSLKQTGLRDMFRKASKSVCTWTGLVPPDAFSPTSSASSAVNIPEDNEQDFDDPESTNKCNIWMEYPSD